MYFPDTDNSDTNARPLYIYVHGGGYQYGDLDTEDVHCRLYSVGVPCIVLSIEYRKTPEWTFPTSFYDVFDSIDWLLEHNRAKEYGIDLSKVILGGVSSGGTMGIAAAVREVEMVSPFVFSSPSENARLHPAFFSNPGFTPYTIEAKATSRNSIFCMYHS